MLRWLTPAFGSGSVTADHPVISLAIAMTIAAIAWFVLLPLMRTLKTPPRHLLPFMLLLGLVLRGVFFGSDAVYENDYKRYLWDGAVVAVGSDPYHYSPTDVFDASHVGVSSTPDLAKLAVLSNQADYITGEINSPDLTTIYPPAAQGVFALAYLIAPFKTWGLAAVFLGFELLGLIALLAGLRARGQPLIWSALYWLNPVIIFTTYNMLHMDVLLVAPLLAALLWAGKRPIIGAIMLSLAAAVKIWPLLLAPVLFREWRHRPIIYISVAVLVAVLTALSLLPMLLTLKDNAGLVAYSATWENSSFLFRVVEGGLGLFTEYSDKITRIFVALSLTSMSLWLGFRSPRSSELMPVHLLLLAAALVFLSPTGYPWYFIWFLMFLPFAVHHWSARGLALLTVGATFYFVRFKLGEFEHHTFYRRVLVPLEFGVPLLVLLWDGLKARRHA
ncbi:glycosyltransferase 87 family protein [Hellea sp.]|nr:glycosyltransferase 87 family protein [Hellea sp.]